MLDIKKYFVKLMSWREQRTNFAEMKFQANEKNERELARERAQMGQQRGRAKASEEIKIPSDREIREPSNN